MKHVLYTAIVQITKKKTEEELDLCMIRVQKSKLIKIVRDDDDDDDDDATTTMIHLHSNTHGCELINSLIKNIFNIAMFSKFHCLLHNRPFYR